MPFKEVINSDKPKHELFDLGDFRVGYFTAKSKSYDKANEDVLFLLEKDGAIIIGVADGAGGHPRGRDAALAAVDSVVNEPKLFKNSELNPFRVMEKANDQVLALKAGARCTLAFYTIHDSWFRSFSVGDSEVVYWNSVGNEVFSNIPHSTVGFGVEAGLIEQEQSLDDPERHIVTNLMGDSYIRMEGSSGIEMKKGHTVLIGTDGLFDNISHEALKDTVAKGDFDGAFNSLLETSQAQDPEGWKKYDDIAWVLLRKVKS